MMPSSDRYPNPFPPQWADAWGDDQYGLWAEFAIKGVPQRMRWIEAGEFWMGSPEHDGNEWPRHRVRLSQGFWLADTACTQAMWQAVMKNNPSLFKGNAQRPVEQVSWLDTQKFFEELAQLGLPGADFPTEAEWEYACRAGTETAYHFGNQINASQANYDGKNPYGGGAQGGNRRQTVSVKALLANAWGLYQMHGNVWEWCKDGVRKYAERSEAVLNPIGLQGQDAFRMVRGGSWNFDAGYLRAAVRLQSSPGNRNDHLGLRIVLRSTNLVEEPQAAEQAQGARGLLNQHSQAF